MRRLALVLALGAAGAMAGCASADDETAPEDVRADVDPEAGETPIVLTVCVGTEIDSGEERSRGSCLLEGPQTLSNSVEALSPWIIAERDAP